MATEHEELRLSVTLNDQASAQLGRLQAALNNIGVAAQKIQQINIGVTGLPSPSQMRGMAAQAGFMGGVVSGVTTELTKMGLEFLKRGTDLEGYSRKMVELSVNAGRASQSAAQFSQTVRDMGRSGVGADAATSQLLKFADAIGNLQREQSSIRQNLMGGLRGTDEIQDMQRLIQRLATSDRSTALQEAKKFSEDIRAHWTRLGQAERGAAAAKDFLNILGIPDLDRMEREIRRVSASQQQLIDARMKDAKVYKAAVDDTHEAMERVGLSIGAIALSIPGVKQTMTSVAGFSTTIAEGFERLEISMRNLNTPEMIKKSEEKREEVATPGETGPLTDQERGKPVQETGLTPEQQERYERRMRRGRKNPAPAPTPQRFMGGGDVGAGGGPGGPVDMSSIPNIGDLLKPKAGAKAAPFNPDDYAGTGWRGLPMSKNVVIAEPLAVGTAGDLVETNTTRMEALANELRRLNDFLAPSNIMNPAFHNAPRGGSRGESNPEKPPKGMKQPGGGAAAEAIDPFGKPTSKDVTALEYAKQHLGTHEIANKAVLEQFFTENAMPLKASAAWCAVYVNSVLKETGHEVSADINAKTSGASAGSFLTNPNYKPATFEDVESGYGTYVGVLKGKSPRTGVEGVHVGILTGESRINPKTGKLEYRMRGGNQPESDENTGEKLSGEGRVVSDIWYDADKLHLRSVPSSDVERGGIGAVTADLQQEISDTNAKTQLASQAQRYTDDGTPDENPLLTGEAFNQYVGTTLRGVTSQVDPERFSQAVENFPESQNVEDRRSVDLSGDPGGLQGTGDWGDPDIQAGSRRWSRHTNEFGGENLSSDLGLQDIPSSRTPGVQNYDPGGQNDPSGGAPSGFAPVDGGDGSGRPGSELPAGSYQEAKRRVDSGRAGRASDAAQDWLGEGAAPREREDRISSLDADVIDRAASDRVEVAQSGLLEVNVNAPEGTTVKAEGEGVLQKTELSRHMSQREMARVDDEEAVA